MNFLELLLAVFGTWRGDDTPTAPAIAHSPLAVTDRYRPDIPPCT